jgi:hypothetical protein
MPLLSHTPSWHGQGKLYLYEINLQQMAATTALQVCLQSVKWKECHPVFLSVSSIGHVRIRRCG